MFVFSPCFLYCREAGVDAGTETDANLYHEVYYHFLGSDQSDDVLCWRDPDHPKYLFSATVTDDGKVIISCFIDFGAFMRGKIVEDWFLIFFPYVCYIMVLKTFITVTTVSLIISFTTSALLFNLWPCCSFQGLHILHILTWPF